MHAEVKALLAKMADETRGRIWASMETAAWPADIPEQRKEDWENGFRAGAVAMESFVEQLERRGMLGNLPISSLAPGITAPWDCRNDPGCHWREGRKRHSYACMEQNAERGAKLP